MLTWTNRSYVISKSWKWFFFYFEATIDHHIHWEDWFILYSLVGSFEWLFATLQTNFYYFSCMNLFFIWRVLYFSTSVVLRLSTWTVICQGHSNEVFNGFYICQNSWWFTCTFHWHPLKLTFMQQWVWNLRLAERPSKILAEGTTQSK